MPQALVVPALLKVSSSNYRAHRAYKGGRCFTRPLPMQQTRDCREKAGEPRSTLGLWDFSAVRGAGEHHCFTPHSASTEWVGALSRCPSLQARSLQCVAGHIHRPSPFQPRTKQASRINKALLHTPGLPTTGLFSLVGHAPQMP